VPGTPMSMNCQPVRCILSLYFVHGCQEHCTSVYGSFFVLRLHRYCLMSTGHSGAPALSSHTLVTLIRYFKYINSDNSHSHHYISTSGPLTKITQRSLNHYTHTQKLVANRHSFPIMAPNDASTQTPSQGHYEVLGLDPACSAAEIKQAHAKIAIDNHPQRIHILTLTNEGKAAADARLLAANAAKEVLLDQEQRDKYDKQLGYDKLRF
jgi:hypothetical protein